MKKQYLLLALILISFQGFAQRYVAEVFTNADVEVTSGVTYATNIDFLTSKLNDQPKVIADLTEIKTALAMQQAIPAKFYNPADTNSKLKVTAIKMDVYKVKSSVDNLTNRPVIIYLHTGNFLPPPINGSPNGSRADSCAVDACMKLARRGYVVISADYRLGWNPIATTVQERRGTLLNAVYRAIHDVKMCVRYLRDDAAGNNTYGIDASKIALLGEGTGGYIAVAYSTLNKYSEMELPKFINPLTTKSYIDTTTVGRIDGSGGLLNLYTSSATSTAVSATVNFGGALADTSWLEAGDAPMIAIQCVRDPFAPFGEGTVIVPTTMEDVVDVQGGNIFIEMANDLGNNAGFRSAEHNDAYSVAARVHYGKIYDYILPSPNDKITVTNSENLYAVVLPLASSRMQNQASPWQWWDPSSAISMTQVAPGVTAHQASLASNPDMSKTKGMTYMDTVIGYMTPRIATLWGYYNPASVNNHNLDNVLSVYPNPANHQVFVALQNKVIDQIHVMDMNGRLVLNMTQVGQTSANVDLSSLNKGIYFVQVVTAEGSAVRKLAIE